MEARTLGQTDLNVTRLGSGWARIGYVDVTPDQSYRLVNDLLGLGVTFVDTFACYHDSEEGTGRARLSLHAATRIAGPDRQGLEHLCRYVARPALAGGVCASSMPTIFPSRQNAVVGRDPKLYLSHQVEST